MLDGDSVARMQTRFGVRVPKCMCAVVEVRVPLRAPLVVKPRRLPNHTQVVLSSISLRVTKIHLSFLSAVTFSSLRSFESTLLFPPRVSVSL